MSESGTAGDLKVKSKEAGPRAHENVSANPHDHTPSSPTPSETKRLTHSPPNALKGITLTAIVTLSQILVAATLSSVLLASPTIGADLNIREDQLQWLTTAYSLSSGCLLIPIGRLADLYGRRKVFIIGCVIQGAFSLGCGFGHSLITLSVLRAVQGIGAAATIPASLGILAHAFPPGHARSLAFATFSSGQPLGGALGFAVGGLLIQFASTTWRTMFYLVAGLAVLCIIGALLVVEPDQPSTEQDTRTDWLGAFLVTAGLVLIVFVLSDGEVAPQQWRTPYIIALLVIGVILVAFFLTWQWYLERPESRAVYSRWTPPPLMKLSLWTRGKGRFAVMQCVALGLMCAFQSWMFWAILYYQNYRQYTPVLTMLRLLPMLPAGILCNVIIGLLIGKVPAVILISAGCLSTGIAGLLFAVINPNAPYWAFGFPAAIVSVVGADFVFAAGSLFIAQLALPHEQSLAGGLFQTMTQLGTAFGLSITTIVFDRVRASESRKMGVIPDSQGLNAPLPAQLLAYKSAQWTVLGFGVFSSILALVFLRGAGIVGGPHKTKGADQQSEKSGDTAA